MGEGGGLIGEVGTKKVELMGEGISLGGETSVSGLNTIPKGVDTIGEPLGILILLTILLLKLMNVLQDNLNILLRDLGGGEGNGKGGGRGGRDVLEEGLTHNALEGLKGGGEVLETTFTFFNLRLDLGKFSLFSLKGLSSDLMSGSGKVSLTGSLSNGPCTSPCLETLETGEEGGGLGTTSANPLFPAPGTILDPFLFP